MAKKKLNINEKRIAQVRDYKNTFSSEQGKRVMWDLIANNYVMQSTFVKNDPYEMALREGQRNAVLRILQVMEVTEEQMQQLIRGANEYVKNRTTT